MYQFQYNYYKCLKFSLYYKYILLQLSAVSVGRSLKQNQNYREFYTKSYDKEDLNLLTFCSLKWEFFHTQIEDDLEL